MLVLPFQFAWAGAAAYCQHEATVPGIWHFGHHEHQHQGQSDLEQVEKQNKTGIHSDCGVCHMASVPFAWAANPGLESLQRVEMAPVVVQAHFTSHNARAPDRPQWPRLA
ncbi:MULTISPECIES: cation efflux protein, CzcI family [Cupriavidus]